MKSRWQEFGSLLKKLRLKENLTQAQLASQLGKSTSEVSRWEKGERRPKLAALLSVSSIFGVQVQELQAKAGYSPEFDWYASLTRPSGLDTDILPTATDEEKKELREYLHFIRFRAQLSKK